MSNSKKYPSSIKAVAMRLTKLDECGLTPAETIAATRLTTASFVMCELEPEYEEGSEIKIKNGDGDVEAYKKGEPRLLGLNGTLKLIGVPIHALEMTIGATLLSSTTPAEVRGGSLPGRTIDPKLCQLELWSRVGVDGQCSTVGSHPYYKWTVPLAAQWMLSGALAMSEEDPTEFELAFFAQASAAYTESIVGEAPDGIDDASVGAGPLSWYTVDALPTIEDNSTYDTASVPV